jgi:peptidoglycan/xylan/chitin deacetylase (PgdA/CDA1 family)
VQTGIPRILDLLTHHRVKATFFVPAWDAQRDPSVIHEIAGSAHEVAGHGYLHEDFSRLAPDQQREVLERSEAAFGDVLGETPEGWRAPRGLMTSDTRAILCERAYRYDSSYCDDDLPYLVAGPRSGRLVEIPVFQTASDSHYYRLRRSPGVVERAWRMEFIAVYQIGGLLNLTLHPRGDFGSGRGVRLRAVDSFLSWLRGYPNVWMTTCGELADWALDPANGALETWPV